LASCRAIARSSRTAADPTASSRTRRRSVYERMVSRCAGSRRAFRSGVPPAYRSQQAEGEYMASTLKRDRHTLETPAVDLEVLRQVIRDEYAVVADDPAHGFHFLVGRPLAQLLGNHESWLAGVPEPTIASFAGTGNSM